jgi:hypothetical protein
MAFSPDQVLKLAGNVLAAGTLDSSGSNWYETRNPNSFIIDPETIWSDLPLMKDFYASNFTEAVNNAVSNPEYFELIGINPDGSFNDDTAIRLTPIAGTNNATYIAYNEFNNPSSGVRKNWILPHLLPRPSGAPSNAYQATIWSGPPSDGNKILTSTGNDGTWVSHFWNAAGGLLLISPNDAPPSASFPNTTLYVTGIGYAGQSGGGGSFSGNSILLESPDGNWRIVNDYPHLRFERRDIDNNGVITWNSYSNMGASIESDGLTLTRPYDITVNFANDALNTNTTPDLRSAFRVSGTEDSFIYGNSQQPTVLETAKGTDIVRTTAVQEEATVTNRPYNDLVSTIDNTIGAAAAGVDLSWVSNINYSQKTEYIRFNELLFDVISVTDNNGDPVASAPCRVSIETLAGDLIQENISIASLNAGINGGFNAEVGAHFYVINPKYSDLRHAKTVTRVTVARGFKVEFKSGQYDYVDTLDNDTVKQQVVPYQQAKVEFLNQAAILDESNYRDLIHKNSQVILDTGLHTYYEGWSDEPHQIVGVGEHVTANHPVLGNYEDRTFVATGSGGLFVLFQDDSTRTTLFTEGDRERLAANAAPTYYIETDSFELDLEGVFSSEMDDIGWDVVNVQHILPLIRYEGAAPISYRTSIYSTVLPDLRFQQNMTLFQLEDRYLLSSHVMNPTIDPVEPEYKTLHLPRNTFTVNRETPRVIKFEFPEKIKLYGYYKDPVDPSDITTGTFVPSIKADCFRVFEEAVVVGSDLEERVDLLQGEKEWAYATENNLPTIHLDESLLALADEDGEWLLFSDIDSLYSDRDTHQWLFSTGTEAYYVPTLADELPENKKPNSPATGVFYAEILVVHVPYESVAGFEVSFGWDITLTNSAWEQVEFEFYIATHGRGMDTKVNMTIPKGNSVNYRFSRRRDGSYSYRATPHNENLASTKSASDLTGNYPVDPNPPIQTT